MKAHEHRTVVIGGGPAGTGLLFNAIRKKELKKFLGTGIAFVEKTGDFACGNIGKYIINSDTEGKVFLECLTNTENIFLGNKKIEAAARIVTQYAHCSVPLPLVGEYLKLLGDELKEQIQNCTSNLFSHSIATAIYKTRAGHFFTELHCAKDDFKKTWIRSDNVVFAMGGTQNRADIINSSLTHDLCLKKYAHKILLTDTLFTDKGLLDAKEIILKSGNKKIVVIGSSHSALTSITTLSNKLNGVGFNEGDITLMHRNKFKVFYPNKEQALKEGYSDFTDLDICPLTHRVNRLGGARLESRELLKKILGLAEEKESRVKLMNINPNEVTVNEMKNVLDQASLIIPAFGYRPRTVPMFNENGTSVTFSSENGGSLVNNKCQVIDSDGKPIPGLFGIGLASGFVPSGKLGGEPNFRGQTNGLWLYQNGIGEIIYDQIVSSANNSLRMSA